MKKVISLLLCLTMIFCLTACVPSGAIEDVNYYFYPTVEGNTFEYIVDEETNKIKDFSLQEYDIEFSKLTDGEDYNIEMRQYYSYKFSTRSTLSEETIYALVFLVKANRNVLMNLRLYLSIDYYIEQEITLSADVGQIISVSITDEDWSKYNDNSLTLCIGNIFDIGELLWQIDTVIFCCKND